MPIKPVRLIVSILSIGLFLLLTSCSLAEPLQPTPTATDSPTATAVVIRETVLVVISPTQPAATPTASLTPANTPTQRPSPTPTRTATLRPSPTPLVLVNIPIEGGDSDNMFFAMLEFPRYQPAATTSLVFRVYAHKPVSSKVDGEGIESVDFTITNSSGGRVHYRQERQAGYCAFGGGEPDCTVLDFAKSSYTWPDGAKITNGTYTLKVIVNSKDSHVMFGETTFRIQVGP
jgi:hypothetical protein